MQLDGGERLGISSSGSFLDEGREGVSAAPSGNPERDKRSCKTDMRMMLGVDANILPRVWSIFFLPPSSPVVPKSTPGTAFCHEIADFGLEAPCPDSNNL